MRNAAFLLVVLAGIVSTLRAVVIAGGTGVEQTTNPGGGLPWNYVGKVNGASGVFLGDYGGDYWVLTASHVVGSGGALGSFTVDGGTFGFVPGSGVVVTNANGSPTDLTLFRISAGPALANLPLALSAPAFGETVALVGYGVRETGAQRFWNVTGSGAGTTWTSVDSASGANASGYSTGNGGTERWGLTNTVDPTSLNLTGSYNVGTGATQALVTEFFGLPGYAQAGGGDSGGALFSYTGSGWELAGVLGSVSLYYNQPAGTSIFGQVTYAGSLAAYNATILSDIGAIPEPACLAAWGGAVAAGFVWWRRRHVGFGRNHFSAT